MGMDRRTFVKRTCIGSAGLMIGGVPALAMDEVVIPPAPPIEVHEAPLSKKSPLGMPGLFPGRVVEVAGGRAVGIRDGPGQLSNTAAAGGASIGSSGWIAGRVRLRREHLLPDGFFWGV